MKARLILENGMIFMAIVYVFISIAGCIVGVYLGKMIVGIRAF